MTDNEKINKTLNSLVDGIDDIPNIRVTKVSPLSSSDSYFIHFRKDMKPGANGAEVAFQIEVAEEDLEEGDAEFMLSDIKRNIDSL